MKYYLITFRDNPFITHEESNNHHIEEYLGDIFITDNYEWAISKGGIEKTKEEAQNLINSSLEGLTYGEYADINLIGQPIVVTLP